MPDFVLHVSSYNLVQLKDDGEPTRQQVHFKTHAALIAGAVRADAEMRRNPQVLSFGMSADLDGTQRCYGYKNIIDHPEVDNRVVQEEFERQQQLGKLYRDLESWISDSKGPEGRLVVYTVVRHFTDTATWLDLVFVYRGGISLFPKDIAQISGYKWDSRWGGHRIERGGESPERLLVRAISGALFGDENVMVQKTI